MKNTDRDRLIEELRLNSESEYCLWLINKLAVEIKMTNLLYSLISGEKKLTETNIQKIIDRKNEL